RELLFEDVGAATSLVDTTPGSIGTGAEQFAAGANGLTGGSVHLQIKSFYSQNDKFPRFRMNGGDGQAGGVGQNGEIGHSVLTEQMLRMANPSVYTCATQNGISAGISNRQFLPAPVTAQELYNYALALPQ